MENAACLRKATYPKNGVSPKNRAPRAPFPFNTRAKSATHIS